MFSHDFLPVYNASIFYRHISQPKTKITALGSKLYFDAFVNVLSSSALNASIKNHQLIADF